jgi:uncharacterized SAM-binding protein YcdF (DUF218 family)
MRHPRARSTRLLLGVLTLLVAAVVAVGGRLFLWTGSDRPERVDAVLVPAGGRGERETTALRLVREGVAPVLAYSDGGRPSSGAGRLCRQPVTGIRVICVTPDTDTTRGEARAFAELAEREGWGSVAVITSSYHATRAGLLLSRCYEGTVYTVAAPPAAGGLRLVPKAAREGAAVVAALTIQPSC